MNNGKAASKSTVEILVRRPRCQACASLLNGIRVDHDKGLYPAYCILEEGHDGPHKNRKSWWQNMQLRRDETAPGETP